MLDTALMKFRNVISRDFSELEIFDLLRILNGIGILIYYFTVLIPRFDKLFLKNGFVSPETFVFYPKSWSFYFQDFQFGLVLLFGVSLFLLMAYTLGFFAKWALIILLPIHLGFHAANPFIIHEPQQLSNLLLILTLFLPIENKWVLKKRRDMFPELKIRESRLILQSLLVYLSLYYFFAGIKKIPDPFWLKGTAVSDILNWPYLGRENPLTLLIKIPSLSKVLTYLTLLFELGFIFVAFTRFRRVLIIIGFFFHLSIGLTMDVGLFFWAMMAWYPVLLIRLKR
jgi:hypothetical protein